MSTTSSTRRAGPGLRASLSLKYPMSIGVFDTYDAAQKAVDTLSDQQFPVQNVLIVGTDLKQMERVTGRLTRGRVALGGLLSGVWLGLFVGLVFSLFVTTTSGLVVILSTAVYGAVFGLVWALIGYALTGGHRDFTSVSQVVATRYEVLVEHKFAQQARELLVAAGLIPGYLPPPMQAPSPPPPPADVS